MNEQGCGNCSGELRRVGTSDGFKQDVEQCQTCLTVWVVRETGAKEPISIGDLTVPEVVNGRFGPQFTVAERAVIATTLQSFLDLGDALAGSELFSAEVTAGLNPTTRTTLGDLIARLQS